MKTFEVNRPTCLFADVRTSVGLFLFQKHCNFAIEAELVCGEDHWKLILTRFRFTSDAESLYALVKWEALVLGYGLV